MMVWCGNRHRPGGTGARLPDVGQWLKYRKSRKVQAGLHEGQIRTTTRRPVVRLLYIGIALVLRNLWVWLHDAILSMPRRGGRVILLERLRWETLLLWLLHVVEEALGVANVTYTERDVQYELAL